jgi:hypothetical protein
LVSNVDAVTQPKAIVVKLERRCHDETRIISSTSPGAAQTFTICAPQTPARVEPFATTPEFSIFAARAITHRTSQKAELFCEICMMRQAAAMIA